MPKNDVLPLNIGFLVGGILTEPELDLLRAIGRWLSVSGQAIYGTLPGSSPRRAGPE